MKINPSIMSSAINRYEKAVHKNTSAGVKTVINDKIDISADAKIYNNLVKAAGTNNIGNASKVEELKNLILTDRYSVAPEKIADAMLE